VSHLSLFYQAQYHDMLAYAYQARGAAVEAVIERIKLEYLLPDDVSKTNNRRALWLSLTQLSQPELDTLMAENSESSVLRGWIALAEISRKQYRDPQDMLNALRRWQTAYANHPANYILPSSIDAMSTQLLASPRHMALMLPLTGPLSGPGHAIQDGFMEAYRTSGQSRQVNVRVYNTDHADVGRVYQHALEEGADYVVGPLTKADVAVVAKMSHPVPTILLNDTARVSDKLAFQFGLSPTNEARQIAEKARKSGYTRALMIAPAGAWGDDVIKAFSDQWTGNGGQVVETWQYAPQDELSSGIRQLLHASEYAAKVRPTKTIRNVRVDNTSQRRHDFDVVILIAYPSKARQIMPLLRYYFAGDMPIYATSAVYSGTENTAKDRDLNGVIFCDMPWVFNHTMSSQHNWSEQLNSYNRLYALGMDSYSLANQLNHLMLFPALGISDKSGVIYLTNSRQLSRILVFGQFKDGVAQKLNVTQD
jgi:outer membrane PBP1 activator LpoA protein